MCLCQFSWLWYFAFPYMIQCINAFELPLLGDFGGINSGLWLVLVDDSHTINLVHCVQSANIKWIFFTQSQLAINHRLKGSEPVQELFCFVSYVVLWTFAFCQDTLTFNSFDEIGWSLENIFEIYNPTWQVAPQNHFSGLSNRKYNSSWEQPREETI